MTWDIDFDRLFDDAYDKNELQFRDPFIPPYGVPKYTTVTQLKVHEFLHKEYPIDKYPEIGGATVRKGVAMIGAKGSAKTYTGAMGAATLAQKFPGSVGCLISNSYPQAKDNGAPHLITVCNILGYECEFFTTKKINGRAFSSVYQIRFPDGRSSHVLIRSYDAIKLLEGIELDWVWSEEGQDAEKDAFTVVWSRNRGQGGDNTFFYMAMPEDGTHWQYDHLENLGFIPEAKYTGPTKQTFVDPVTNEEEVAWFDGIMYEIGVFENKANVGNAYIAALFGAYDEEMAKKYIYGERGSLSTNKVYYSYADHLHRAGRMSEICCHYDPYEDLIFIIDFNVYPMTCSVWQVKPWHDAWWASSLHDSGALMGTFLDEKGDKVIRPIENLGELGAANRSVMAQVDEFEVYTGGTEGMMKALVEKYQSHDGRTIFQGDATGNSKKTSATKTDWDIIAEYSKHFKEAIIKRGPIANTDIKKGETKYSNPLNRDAVNNANRMLKDANGRVHICFLPKSKLSSKGTAASVAALRTKPNGDWDVKDERKLDKSVVRSHHADTFKYCCWFWKYHEAFLKGKIQTNVSPTTAREWAKEDQEYNANRTGFAF